LVGAVSHKVVNWRCRQTNRTESFTWAMTSSGRSSLTGRLHQQSLPSLAKIDFKWSTVALHRKQWPLLSIAFCYESKSQKQQVSIVFISETSVFQAIKCTCADNQIHNTQDKLTSWKIQPRNEYKNPDSKHRCEPIR